MSVLAGRPEVVLLLLLLLLLLVVPRARGVCVGWGQLRMLSSRRLATWCSVMGGATPRSGQGPAAGGLQVCILFARALTHLSTSPPAMTTGWPAGIYDVPKMNELLASKGMSAAAPEFFPEPSCPFYQVCEGFGGANAEGTVCEVSREPVMECPSP